MSGEYTEKIYQAEQLRVAGKTREATTLAKEYLTQTNPAHISVEELTDQARMARIFVVSSLSTARKQWIAPKVVSEMIPARDLILGFYKRPVVKERLYGVDKDNQGHTYEFLAEMHRDVYKYNVVSFHVTGQRQFLMSAANEIEQVMQLTNSPQVSGIASVESFQLFQLFNRDKRRQLTRYEIDLHNSIIPTLRAIEISGDRDRMAWYLLNLMHETSRLSGDKTAVYARNAFQLVNKELAKQFGDREAFVKEFKFNRDKAVQSLRTRIWSLTRNGIDSSVLLLH